MARRTVQGTVVSDVSDKTIVVSVVTRMVHPLYKKRYNLTKKYMAHDEKNEAKKDDIVIIEESRPLSKRKRWALKSVVGTAGIKHTESPEDEVTL